MKTLKKIYRMFATGNVIEDISFLFYLLLMISVGLYVLSLTAAKEIMVMCVSMLGVLAIAVVYCALAWHKEEKEK